MLAAEGTPRSAELVYDRRTSPRVVLEAPALIDAYHGWRKCSVKSVSAAGICVMTEWALPVGARVDVYFEIPRALAVESQAEVVRQGDGELAFRFIALDEDARSALQAFVESHADVPLPSQVVVC